MNILGTAATVFTTKADLRAAVQAYANPTAAIATYGAVAGLDVSAITDMGYLFFMLGNFNATRKASAAGPAPRKAAKATSRRNPRIRLMPVRPLIRRKAAARDISLIS